MCKIPFPCVNLHRNFQQYKLSHCFCIHTLGDNIPNIQRYTWHDFTEKFVIFIIFKEKHNRKRTQEPRTRLCFSSLYIFIEQDVAKFLAKFSQVFLCMFGTCYTRLWLHARTMENAIRGAIKMIEKERIYLQQNP